MRSLAGCERCTIDQSTKRTVHQVLFTFSFASIGLDYKVTDARYALSARNKWSSLTSLTLPPLQHPPGQIRDRGEYTEICGAISSDLRALHTGTYRTARINEVKCRTNPFVLHSRRADRGRKVMSREIAQVQEEARYQNGRESVMLTR